jgi:hypothetical protein
VRSVWDDGEVWGDGLRSLACLERFLLRTRRSIREVPSVEDDLVREWLVSPPVLTELIIWFQVASATGGTGDGDERFVRWSPLEEGTGWSKTYERRGRVDKGDFI